MRRPLLAALLATALAPAAFAEVPRVMTDIPAVHSLTAQVMGDLGSPAVLLEQGGNAHNYALKPSQAQALQEADLVIWVGPAMTPWLDRAIKGVNIGGKQVELLAAEPTHRQEFGAGPHEHEEEHEHEAEHAAEHAEAEHTGAEHTEAGHDDHDHDAPGHTHEGLDPHAWLTPENAEIWLGLIADELSAADPANAATYAANAKAAKEGVAALDARLQAQLAPVQGRPFVVFHDAYGYFAAHYGLSVAGAVALGDATSPGAGHLAELRENLAHKGVVCAFPEAAHDPKQIDILLEGTSVKRGGTLDPSGANLAYGPGLYATLMGNLASTLVACLAP